MPPPADHFYLDTRTSATANFCQHSIKDGILHYELAETRIFLDMVESAETVLDVGAHIGYYSLLAAAVDSVRRVLAFEPLPLYAEEIERHLARNGVDKVEVVRSPVGREGQTLEYGNFLAQSRRECTLLDRLVLRRDWRVEVVKIDVEGAELDVLSGASNMLMRDRPFLIVGIHPHLLAKEFRGAVGDVLALLHEREYRLYRLNDVEGSGPAPLPGRELVDPVRSLMRPLEVDGSMGAAGSGDLFTLVAYPAEMTL